jgi:predicted TPR repeat methyltransferase
MKTFLNIDQSPDELSELYGERDYYWYLRSLQFDLAFLQPLAAKINSSTIHGCLDVGCGEGQLGRHVTVPYLGFDGSDNAIHKAIASSASDLRRYCVARMESFTTTETFDTVVFGGIMFVLVLPDQRVNLFKHYAEMTKAERVFIYDLEELDTSTIDSAFDKVWELHDFVDLDGPNMVEVKKYRKVVEYSCT